MRKLIAITQVSLDGVMQGPGGEEEDTRNGFTEGGWVMPYVDETAARVITKLMSGEFDLLLGRWTYDLWTSYWPNHADNPIGKAFNKATKFVVTHRQDELRWKNSERISDAVEGVRRLKASNGPEIHLWGSSQLMQTLVAADLIDEYRLWVFPVVLGKGKRLFENGVPPRGLTLVQSGGTASGVLFNTYRPAGLIPKAEESAEENTTSN